jgi:hypothetical protein
MAYRSILGGSPLGIIGVKSAATPDGYTSFNIDKSRNVRVQDYNKSNAGTLFTGKRRIRAWADISALKPVKEIVDGKETGEEYQDITGTSIDRTTNIFTQQTLHSDSVYDTSILNIIEKLANTKGQLKPADFAYLKHIGVYPNNRLMIARRFAGPTPDNIMIKKKPTEIGSLATLITWVPESEDFLNISFGEEWMEAEADFKGVLSSLGEDIGIGNLGGIGGAAGNITPLPGFTEIFQRQFLASLNLIEKDSANMIPAGNPNLIKQAKMRKTVGYTEAGSGLTCTVNVKMVCEYELKYISGIDPTIVWMDLIGTILRFGTSESETYGLSKSVSGKLIRWANDPSLLLNEVFSSIKNTLTETIDKVKVQIEKVFADGVTALHKATESEKSTPKGTNADYVALLESKRENSTMIESISKLLGEVADDLISGVVQKYRVKIIGIINSLSGLPSTPWHLTIGNPMRPIFCSGDMLTKSVSLKLGPQLAFNDLPSSISVEFTLENARALGMQEIMAKFNSGYLRSIDVQKTYYETNQVTTPGGKTYNEPIGGLPGEAVVPPDVIGSTASGTASGGTASVNGGGPVVNNNIGDQNSLQSGNTKINSNGSVTIISSTQSEVKSYNKGGGEGSDNKTISDPHDTQPAAAIVPNV